MKTESITSRGTAADAHVYAILPSDLEIPTEYDAFMKWKTEIGKDTAKRSRTNQNSGLIPSASESSLISSRSRNEYSDEESPKMREGEAFAPPPLVIEQPIIAKASQKKKTWINIMAEEDAEEASNPMSGGRTALAKQIPLELVRQKRSVTRKSRKPLNSRSKTRKPSIKLKRSSQTVKRNIAMRYRGSETRKSKSKGATTTFSEGYQARMTEPITTGKERTRSAEDTKLIQEMLALLKK